MSRSKPVAGPKILYIDIETAPDLAWVWGVYQQNAIEVSEHWQILTFAWRWGARGKTQVLGLDDTPGRKRSAKLSRNDDWWLMRKLGELLHNADIVVAHNGRAFDTRKINARMIALEIPPPAPYQVIDTKNETARVAAFSSNRLDWLGDQLGLGRKLKHEGFGMWRGCMDGDAKAWAKMKRYNKHDITLLVRLHQRIQSWIRQPNAALWGRTCTNPLCRGSKLQARGIQRAKTRVYQRFQCQKCGTWSRSVFSEKGKGASLVEAA
jgi:RNase P subunit RPR2